MKTNKTFDICMYGNAAIGYGFLAAAGNTLVGGNGEPAVTRSLTDCLFLGVDALRTAGETKGDVHVYAPGGEQMATFLLSGRTPYYGELRWGPAPAYTLFLESEAKLKAQEKKS